MVIPTLIKRGGTLPIIFLTRSLLSSILSFASISFYIFIGSSFPVPVGSSLDCSKLHASQSVHRGFLPQQPYRCLWLLFGRHFSQYSIYAPLLPRCVLNKTYQGSPR